MIILFKILHFIYRKTWNIKIIPSFIDMIEKIHLVFIELKTKNKYKIKHLNLITEYTNSTISINKVS